MQDLKIRAFNYAASAGKLIIDLPNNAVNKACLNQLAGARLLLGQITVRKEEQNQTQILKQGF